MPRVGHAVQSRPGSRILLPAFKLVHSPHSQFAGNLLFRLPGHGVRHPQLPAGPVLGPFEIFSIPLGRPKVHGCACRGPQARLLDVWNGQRRQARRYLAPIQLGAPNLPLMRRLGGQGRSTKRIRPKVQIGRPKMTPRTRRLSNHSNQHTQISKKLFGRMLDQEQKRESHSISILKQSRQFSRGILIGRVGYLWRNRRRKLRRRYLSNSERAGRGRQTRQPGNSFQAQILKSSKANELAVPMVNGEEAAASKKRDRRRRGKGAR